MLDFLNDELRVDQMMISPAYAYWKALDQDHFLGVEQTRELFRQAFAGGRRRRWRLNHSPLFLDFLEGKADFACTAWGIPSYSVFGWQRPCYLMSDGYAKTYRELVETTDWSAYGRGRDPRCANCMAHCGYEPTAVLASMGSLKQSLRALTRAIRRAPPAREAEMACSCGCDSTCSCDCCGEPESDAGHRRLGSCARRSRAWRPSSRAASPPAGSLNSDRDRSSAGPGFPGR